MNRTQSLQNINSMNSKGLITRFHPTWWSYTGWCIFANAHGLIDIHQWGIYVAAAWDPPIGGRSGMHNSSSKMHHSIRLKNVWRLLMFERCCDSGETGWESFIGNSDVRCRILDFYVQPAAETLNVKRLRWLEHVSVWPQKSRLVIPCSPMKIIVRSGQSMTP